MRAVFLFLTVGLAFVAAAPKNDQRIVGGSLTTIGAYPTIVSLLYSMNTNIYRHICGGTVINNRSILTAAQCVYGDHSTEYRARVGSTYANSGGVVHGIQSLLLHPQFNQQVYMDSDVAIIRTLSVIQYVNNAVQPALIAGTNYGVPDNSVVWAAGWGLTNPNDVTSASEQLRHVQVWTVNQAECYSRYNVISISITQNMLCSGWLDVGGRDQCYGDSGSPLYHNGVVVGVRSFGESCGLPGFPGVNARVSSYTTWIQANA